MRLETHRGYVIGGQARTYGYSKHIGEYAVAAAVNGMMAEGAGDIGISARITVPVWWDSYGIHGIRKCIEGVCGEKGFRLLEIEALKSPALQVAEAAVTGISGTVKEGTCAVRDKVRAGQDIVLTKWIGMEGMLRITEEKKEELAGRFAPGFLKQIRSFRPEIFAEKEMGEIREHGAAAIRQITEGGILAALWYLSRDIQTGIRLDMKNISVLQETVEVCEHFRLNPYQLTSAGSFLVVADQGEILRDRLLECGVKAAVIGRVTDGHDKVIYNGEDIRYIDRPAPDEIFRIFDI